MIAAKNDVCWILEGEEQIGEAGALSPHVTGSDCDVDFR